MVVSSRENRRHVSSLFWLRVSCDEAARDPSRRVKAAQPESTHIITTAVQRPVPSASISGVGMVVSPPPTPLSLLSLSLGGFGLRASSIESLLLRLRRCTESLLTDSLFAESPWARLLRLGGMPMLLCRPGTWASGRLGSGNGDCSSREGRLTVGLDIVAAWMCT